MAGAANQFVHLHVHSQYSLLDGACRVADMVKRAKELEQKALAVTDHGCLFGVVDFYSKAIAAGIKPIIGMEAYMAPGSRHERVSTGVKDGGYHLLLLAADRAGYQNLLKLASIAYTEGFYYKPRIDKEVLRAHKQGLIATSACLGGEIPSALTADNRKKAKEIAEVYLEIFGPDRFFIEVQKHIVEQDKVNPELMDLAERLGVGSVATNDVHFLLQDDHGPHDALCCIATGKLLSDESRLKYPTQLYLKSSAEMYAASEHPKWAQACANTVRIAEMCNVELDFGKSHAPVVRVDRATNKQAKKSEIRNQPSEIPVGSTQWYQSFCENFQLQPFDEIKDKSLSPADLKKQCDAALRELGEAGLTWRYGASGVTDEHRQRLDRELRILADKNISAYFLIVWDFVNEARRRGIPASARGSGVGTMVGYCLGLSNACPVKYGLLFERFTDPDRSEYPDIDIDICQDGRQAIIDYVRNKYGHVAQIITFGTLKARAAIRDVGRVLNVPLVEVDKLCKLVGETLGMTIDKALDQEPDLAKLYHESPTTKRVLDTARRIEGLARHSGVHAAGVVIATQPLDNIIPLCKPAGTDQLVTQWDGPTVEKMGLLKMDFLGLRTLSIIERARQLIRATLSPEVIRATVEGSSKFDVQSSKSDQSDATSSTSNFELRTSNSPDPLDLDRLTYDDQTVLDLFRRGETGGIFQFESGGMRNLLMAMKPDRLEDLIAANALYRPGPMDLIPEYNARKHGKSPVPKGHPIVDQYTAETYGIMVYQEQVMQIVHGLGDIPLRAAYTLIKNISKKKRDAIDAARPKFVEGAHAKGLTKPQAEELFDLILKFAGYGFNKSHSTGYAIIAYQTAYLKTYFPIQYMAAVLTYESVNIDKVVQYIDECRRVLLPTPGSETPGSERPGSESPGSKRGIDVKPPDITLSDVAFTVVYGGDEPHDASHGHIRFGLSAVKGVGDKAILAIIEARKKGGPFKSLYDFAERVPLNLVNRATIEALIKCGAFDALHGMGKRAAMVEALDSAIQAGQRAASDRDSGQLSFFGALAGEEAAPGKGGAKGVAEPVIQLPGVPPWPNADMLKHEKSVLGFYVSSHPLDQHRDTMARYSSAAIADIRRLPADVDVVLGGLLTRVRTTFTKSGRSPGQKMAMITVEDSTGPMDGVIFSDAYATYAPLIEPDRVVFLRGKVDRRREEPSIIVSQVIPVEQASEQLTQTVRIVINPGAQGANGNGNGNGQNRQLTLQEDLVRLRELLRQAAIVTARHPATAQVQIEVQDAGQIVRLRLNNARVCVTNDLPQRIDAVLRAPGSCELLGPAKVQAKAMARPSPGMPGMPPGMPPGMSPGISPGIAADPGYRPLPARQTAEDEFCESIDRY